MSMTGFLAALHALRTSLIAPDVIRHGDNITVGLTCKAGIRLEDFIKYNATPSMASCLPVLFKEDGDHRSVTIEGVTFKWPVCCA